LRQGTPVEVLRTDGRGTLEASWRRGIPFWSERRKGRPLRTVNPCSPAILKKEEGALIRGGSGKESSAREGKGVTGERTLQWRGRSGVVGGGRGPDSKKKSSARKHTEEYGGWLEGKKGFRLVPLPTKTDLLPCCNGAGKEDLRGVLLGKVSYRENIHLRKKEGKNLRGARKNTSRTFRKGQKMIVNKKGLAML